MKKILVFGAGKSAWFTIHYLLEHANANGWTITVADSSERNIRACTHDFPGVPTQVLDVHDILSRQELVRQQNLVISLLPARFHILLAEDCLEFGINLITPSYITPDLEMMDEEVRAKGLLFLNELGLDPGIDHMSAMHIIDRLKAEGAEISSFKSYCGGLVAPQNDDNPWHYKFSWNPYNVVRAGQDGGMCLQKGNLHYVPYTRLFDEIDTVKANSEIFEAYLNRNSLRYIPLYNLHEAKTFIRGTLRTRGFCKKWDLLVRAGLTSDKVQVDTSMGMKWKDFADIFLPDGKKTLKEKLSSLDHNHISDEDVAALDWLFKDAMLPPNVSVSPVDALQILLEDKWRMNITDKDRVVMIHEFEYKKNGSQYRLTAWMDIIGEDASRTAMAKTVGLPLALAAELIANGKITTKGVMLPTVMEIYEPLLEALSRMQISFQEKVEKIG